MGQQLSLRHRLSWWKQPVGNMVLFWKGCRPEPSTCILTLFGKPMMLLEGNGFIKVLTPMKATVWSHADIYKLLCLKKMPLSSMNYLSSSLLNSVLWSWTQPISENGPNTVWQIDVPDFFGTTKWEWNGQFKTNVSVASQMYVYYTMVCLLLLLLDLLSLLVVGDTLIKPHHLLEIAVNLPFSSCALVARHEQEDPFQLGVFMFHWFVLLTYGWNRAITEKKKHGW